MVLTSTLFITAAAVATQDSYTQTAQRERAILMELYKATSGNGWTRHGSWGSDRSMCYWDGVSCDHLEGDEKKPVVSGIDLSDNNLHGVLPEGLAELRHLNRLDVSRNRLTGTLPEALLQRWDRHELDLMVTGNSFSNVVSTVMASYSATGTLCSLTDDIRYRLDIDQTGRAVFQSLRCADANPQSRRVSCLVKEGTIFTLARFSRSLQQLNVREFKPEYDYPGAFFTTHQVQLTTSVTWGDGTKSTVSTYARQGPLNVWMAQQLFLALQSDVSWEKEYRKPKCDFP